MSKCRIALLGNPINKSESPVVYGVLSSLTGIDIQYDLRQCPDFRAAVSDLLSSGYDGFNITLPFKTTAADSVARLMPTAAECNAANCAKFIATDSQDCKFPAEADNTDAQAFLWALRDRICGNGKECAAANYPWLPYSMDLGKMTILKEKKAAILGAGGAAMASAWAFAKMGIGNIVFHARNIGKAEKIASKMKSIFPNTVFYAAVLPENGIEYPEFFANATPLGMYGGKVPAGISEKTVLVADWPYLKCGTDFICDSEKLGIECISGMELLLRQAILNLRFWTGADICGLYGKSAAILHGKGYKI